MDEEYKLHRIKLRKTMRTLRQRYNTTTWVSKFMKVHRNTVDKWFNRTTETVIRTKRECKFTKEVFNFAIKLNSEGYSLRSIAVTLNEGLQKNEKRTISHTTVASFLKEDNKK